VVSVTEPTASRRRTVLLIVHTGRKEAVEVACAVASRLMTEDMTVRLLEGEAPDLAITGAEVVPEAGGADGCELAVVIGGDGTILRGAEWDDLESTVDSIIAARYSVEERLTVDVSVTVDGTTTAQSWALNEASIEKAARQRMIEVVVEVNDRPLSRWGCDGVVFATPTGSTAYAFSAGGPVVWPEVEALLLVPISAHALFARPMVASPGSVLAVELLPNSEAVLWCDGRRMVELPPGARVEVCRGKHPILLARLHQAEFTDRLVAKFGLPVAGWRGAGERRLLAEEAARDA
jgi:NAD+ kinase